MSQRAHRPVPPGGGVLVGGKTACQPTMISTESTIATMKFFWSIVS
jgi:hypothetical protein